MVRDSGGRIFRWLKGILAWVGLLFLLVVFTPFVSWYAEKLAQPWADPPGDVVIVLSAAEPNSGVMDISTYWRCFMVIVYYRERPYRRIVVSGKGSAPGMRDFLVLNGIPADRILVENEAADTHENAIFTARLLAGESGRIVLLTSDIHLYRARRAFEKAGLKVIATPVGDVIKRAAEYSMRPALFVEEIQESLRIVYYRYRGWI